MRTAALGVLVSANAIFVLLYGILGIGGNQIVTAAIIVAPLLLLVRAFRPLPFDYLYLAFVLLVVASVIANGRTTTNREYALLAVTLFAYPAFRSLGNRFEHSSFAYITGAIVAAGTLAMGWAFLHSAGGSYRPHIFGFGDGATQFTLSLCFLIFAVVAVDPPWRRLLVICGLIAPPLFMFAAAMVRHPFVAMSLALVALAIVARSRQVAAVLAVIFLSFLVGLSARPDVSRKLIEYATQNTMATCDSEDTIAIRKILAKEALVMIPGVGAFGTGIGSFAERSCYKSFPHNVYLQAAVEFGVTAALILIGLFAAAFISAARRVRSDPVARFVFLSLVFVGVESCVSGSLSNSILLFGFMGWAVGLEKANRTGLSPAPAQA